MSSENRAAAALSRAYPGGHAAFVAAMNQKAIELGMWRTRFVDSTGLSSDNVSTAEDLAKMVAAAYHYQLMRDFTTDTAHAVRLAMAGFSNTGTPTAWSRTRAGISVCPRPVTSARPVAAW